MIEISDGLYLLTLQSHNNPAFALIRLKGVIFKITKSSRVFITPYRDDFLIEYGAKKCDASLPVFHTFLKVFVEVYNRNPLIEVPSGEDYILLQ